MKVLTMFKAPVRSAGAVEPLSDVAATMAFYDVGALPVIERGILVGIVTERDIIRAIGDEADLRVTEAGEYMTRGPVAVGPDEDVARAVALMAAHGTRHLPVIEHGSVVGMLSARDLLAANPNEIVLDDD